MRKPRPESNVEAHKQYLAEVLADECRHSRGYQIKRWHPLFGTGFAEHGWPQNMMPVLEPVRASEWKTRGEAAQMLIDRVPWCANHAKQFFEGYFATDEQKFTEIFCRCPAEILVDILGLSEVVRLWQMSFICCDFGDLAHMCDMPNVVHIIDKVRVAYWQATVYSGGSDNQPIRMAAFYNRVRRVIEGLRNFDFGVRGMQTYVDTASTMRWGPCVVNSGHYIDAHLCFNICMGDKQVLTIAFTPTEHGIAVCQVQVKDPTGNRWLYGIGEHILDYALERMRVAFPDEELLLVSGGSAMLFVEGNHTAESKPPRDVLLRICDLYNRPLARFDRAANPIPMSFIGGREFYPLVRKVRHVAA